MQCACGSFHCPFSNSKHFQLFSQPPFRLSPLSHPFTPQPRARCQQCASRASGIGEARSNLHLPNIHWDLDKCEQSNQSLFGSPRHPRCRRTSLAPRVYCISMRIQAAPAARRLFATTGPKISPSVGSTTVTASTDYSARRHL